MSRRLLTVPGVGVGLAVVSALLPALLLAAAGLDLGRSLFSRRPPVAMRLVCCLQVYLLAEVVGLVALGLVWLGSFGQARLLRWTYAVQRAWTAALFESSRWLLDLRYEVDGDDCASTGPLLVFVQHASILDTLVPTNVITRRHRLTLRFVLKRELLLSPCLDVAGQRLPNVFVDRSSTHTEAELRKIRALATGLSPNEGALIYPEGTRFTRSKRERALGKLAHHSAALLGRARALRHVLPPKVGGSLALLDGAPEADAVFIAHHGLEGFASLGDIWRGGLVHSTIRVHLWRVPRGEVPTGESERIDWLYSQWSEVDRWVDAQQQREAA